MTVLFLVSLLASAQVDLNKGLLVHLKLDGNTADSSGNGNDATIISATPTKNRLGIDSRPMLLMVKVTRSQYLALDKKCHLIVLQYHYGYI